MGEPILDMDGDMGTAVQLLCEAAAEGPTAIAGDTGGIFVFGHDEVERLARHPHMVGTGLTLFDILGVGEGPLRRWYGSLMFTNEGSHHLRLRRLVSRAFTPRSVELLRDHTVRLVADAYDRIEADGGGDLLAELKDLPMRVMCSLLGAPETDLDAFMRWGDALSPTFGIMSEEQTAAAEVAIVEMLAYVHAMVEDIDLTTRDDGRGHLLTALVQAEDDGDRLTRDETVDMVTNLLVAGHDTTGSQIGCTLLTLLRDAEALTTLRADPSLASSAGWEGLRVEPSILATVRVNLEPIEIGDMERPAGSLLFLTLATANRDAATWPEPDRMRVDRFVSNDVPKPLSFGTGPHFCLGSHMARMTIDETVAGLARNPVSLAGDPDDIEWVQVLGRSPVALEVAFG